MALQETNGVEKRDLIDVRLGSPLSMCPTCHKVFSVPRNFDKHRNGGVCLHPTEVGLILDKHGVYRAPPPKHKAAYVQ